MDTILTFFCSNLVLCSVCKSLLCPAYSEQISQFLLPAMAYGKYPFPFVDLIQALITQTAEDRGTGKNVRPQRQGERDRVHVDWTQWLLGAFLSLGDKHIGKDEKSSMFSCLYMSHVMRKPVLCVCEQQRSRSACPTMQSDQHFCYSLPG